MYCSAHKHFYTHTSFHCEHNCDAGRMGTTPFTYQVRKAKFRELKPLVQGHGQQVAKARLETKNNESLLSAIAIMLFFFLVWQLRDLVVHV